MIFGRMINLLLISRHETMSWEDSLSNLGVVHLSIDKTDYLCPFLFPWTNLKKKALLTILCVSLFCNPVSRPANLHKLLDVHTLDRRRYRFGQKCTIRPVISCFDQEMDSSTDFSVTYAITLISSHHSHIKSQLLPVSAAQAGLEHLQLLSLLALLGCSGASCPEYAQWALLIIYHHTSNICHKELDILIMSSCNHHYRVPGYELDKRPRCCAMSGRVCTRTCPSGSCIPSKYRLLPAYKIFKPHKIGVLGKVNGFSCQRCQPLPPLPVKKSQNQLKSLKRLWNKPVGHTLGRGPSTACFGPWPVLEIHSGSSLLWNNNAQKLNICTTSID